MNGVKGYILKELWLRRKSFISSAVTYILLFILAASFCLSFDYGNMKNNENISPDTCIILAYALAAAGIVIIDGQYGETITKDIKCKWNIFELTLPMTPQKRAAVRIGLLSGMHLLATVVSTLFSMIIFALAHVKFTASVAANIAAVSIAFFVVIMLGQFMVLLYKDPQKAATRFMLIFMVIYVPLVGYLLNDMRNAEMITEGTSNEELNQYLLDTYLTPLAAVRDTLFPFALLIFAAFVAIGYFLFLYAIKRREK